MFHDSLMCLASPSTAWLRDLAITPRYQTMWMLRVHLIYLNKQCTTCL